MPLHLVLRWWHVGTSHAQAQTLVLWTSDHSLLGLPPRSLPSPTPNTVQYSNPGFAHLLPPLV